MPILTARQINKIPVAERIILAEKLWESIPENSDQLGLSALQKRELDKRLDDLKAGHIQTVSWSQVKSKLRSRRVWK